MKYKTTDNYIQFEPDNIVRFCLDHRLWENIPSEIKFYPTKIFQNGLVDFVGEGYGSKEKYGNGSIALFEKDLEPIMEWIKLNLCTDIQ